jgi:hypothetical protein
LDPCGIAIGPHRDGQQESGEASAPSGLSTRCDDRRGCGDDDDDDDNDDDDDAMMLLLLLMMPHRGHVQHLLIKTMKASRLVVLPGSEDDDGPLDRLYREGMPDR